MDISHAKTFVAIIDTGSFIDASARLNVTQSTVSARIKSLEDQLGTVLFIRNKSGATPTPAGTLFHKHATAMIRVWEHARLEIALPEGYTSAFSIGGSYSLWDGFLMEWLSRMRATAPEIAIRSRPGSSTELMQAMTDGTLDIGVMYTPQARPGLSVDALFEDTLVLVSSESADHTVSVGSYVFIDWGPEFSRDHNLHFPDLVAPGIQMELGALGLKYLLANPASGYFPERLIAGLVSDGTLRRVESAPVFRYPVYAVYPASAEDQGLVSAIDTMKAVATEFGHGLPTQDVGFK